MSAIIVREIKDSIDSNLYNLKKQFNSHNTFCCGELKDYGHIATKIVILQEVLGWIETIEEEYR